MGLNLKVNSKKTTLMVKDLTVGPTEEFTQGIGMKIKCMVKENSLGVMEENM